MTPSRHDSVTMTCPVCGSDFVSVGRQRWCSGACRSAGYRQRKQLEAPSVVIPALVPRGARSVYQCDICDTRSLGIQRCEDCGSFMRRIGFGGLCPCCEEPIAVFDLVPEAEEDHL